MPSLRTRRRFGLRSRVSVGLAISAAIVAGLLAGGAYVAIRSYLLEQREDAAMTQAFLNARVMRDGLNEPSPKIPALLDSLPARAGSQALLSIGDRWFGRTVSIGAGDLPAPLIATIDAGTGSRQRFDVGNRSFLAVGVPLLGLDARYVEVFSLDDLDRTLSTIGASLTIAAVTTAVLAALLGLAASRRVLRPLATVATTAEQIAAGDLSARLGRSDPDLDPLVRSFNEMADSLQARISRDAQFASDVSHEMRSPLTSLRTAVQLMRSRLPPLDDRAQVAVDLVESQVRRFERMVLDLLEISRMDAGVAPLQLDEVDLGSTVCSLVSSLTGGRVPVTVAPDAAGRRARIDARRFEWVVSNLIDNADQHGGGCVGVAVLAGDGELVVAVDDAGPGIPEAERARVFERFARGSTARHRAGSGLGLALVREHVRLMHGTVAATDAPAGGARLVVHLPEARS